jgi:NAD-dependent SIR2 family protein deacetylase
MQSRLVAAAAAIRDANAVLILSGAGLGVDSGLPDFRGKTGFWRAYPPMQKLGLEFAQMSTPHWFTTRPALAWGFFGHRYQLYKNAPLHDGYHILKRIAESKERHFSFTSNVDGLWHRVLEPDRIFEVHGSLLHLQCSDPCCAGDIWVAGAENDAIVVDPESFEAELATIPHCPTCAAKGVKRIARPNVLMFNDDGFVPDRADQQEARFRAFRNQVLRDPNARLVVIEVGAGEAVPTVRLTSESMLRDGRQLLIRINPRDTNVPEGQISLPLGGADAMRRIDALLSSSQQE